MKKLIFLVCFVAVSFAATNVKAQYLFQKGDGILNASIGLGSGLYSGFGYTTVIPALAVSYEVGIMDDLIDGNGSIGIGGYLGLSSYRWRYTAFGANYGYNYTTIVVGPRGTFHYQFIEKLDTYAGVMLAASIVNSTEVGIVGAGFSASGSGLVFDTFIGARYYFNDNIAALAELGFGVSYLNLGASFRLK